MGIRPRISTRDAACAGPTRRFSKTTPAQSQGRLREILGELLPDQAEAGSRDHGSPRDLLAPPSKDGATRPPRRASDRAPTGTGRGVKRKTKESQGDKRRLERQCAPLDRTAGVTTSAPRRSEHDETGKAVRPASSSCTLE